MDGNNEGDRMYKGNIQIEDVTLCRKRMSKKNRILLLSIDEKREIIDM